jgi:subtilisin-like proprotein convertase family protein
MGENGTDAFGWLGTLIPGISVVAGGSSSVMNLTSEGVTAFPTLPNSAVQSAVPWHDDFEGNLGPLQALAQADRGGILRNVILGRGAAPPPTNQCVLTCPGNVTQTAESGQCTAVVNFDVGLSNCVSSTFVCSPRSGDTFAIGTTTVTCSATDTNNLTNTCAFTVTINARPPGITCPPNVTVNANSGSCVATGVSLGTPTVINNCGNVIVTSNAPASYPLGTNFVVWIVRDNRGNSGSCVQRVFVRDTQPPALACPANVTVPANAPGPSATNVALGTPVASDNCTLASVTSNAPGSFPAGTNVVTWTARDASGNSNSCQQLVVVLAPPTTITCPPDVNTFADAGVCFASGVSLGTPVVSNSCAVASLTNNAPAQFPLGTNLVHWTVTDQCGNSAACDQRVIVRDNEPPALHCSGNLVFSTDPGRCTRSNVVFSLSYADNCSSPVLAQPAGLPSGATFPKGTTTNRFVVTDAAGNTNACSFTVTINDTEPPSLACPADLEVNAPFGTNSVSNVPLGTPVTADNCAVASVTSNAPSSYPLGTNFVTWTVHDTSGNTATCQQRVTVVGGACATNLNATALASQTVCPHSLVLFQTTVTTPDPATFQWRFNGQTLVGATSNSLWLANVSPTNSGTYRVEVRTPCRAVTNSATLTVRPLEDANPASYTNYSGITINDFSTTPYPSVIAPQCVPGRVRTVTVTLYNFSHSFPGDVSVLLVGPNQKGVKLLADVRGDNSPVSGVNLTFSDAATAYVPDPNPILSGTYLPTDFRPNDSLPAPAPTGPYSNSFSIFRGADPNGPWHLYAFDDALGDGGSIGAWGLNFSWAVIPVLVNPRMTNNAFQADVLGTTGVTVVIERSTNLLTWLPITTNVLTASQITFTDPQAALFPTRFYRGVQ